MGVVPSLKKNLLKSYLQPTLKKDSSLPTVCHITADHIMIRPLKNAYDVVTSNIIPFFSQELTTQKLPLSQTEIPDFKCFS